MSVDAFIHLDRLRCLAEDDGSGHSEPYVWTVLLWVDDATIGSGQIVGSRAPGNTQGARAVVKEGIKAGEEAPMPAAQRRFARRFEDGLTVRQVGIVVAMFEEDETPEDAVRAAYDAFRRELPSAVAQFIRTHLRGPETDAEREEIAARVRPQVLAAGEGALSSFEKLQVFLGTLNLDDEVGFASFFTEIQDDQQETQPFSLRFLSKDERNNYEIDGRFELRTPPAPDRCQAQIDRVNQARADLAGVQAEIRSLQDELREAPPSQKPSIIREIRRIRTEEVPALAAALEATQRALDRCRAGQGVLVDGVVVADPLVFDPRG